MTQASDNDRFRWKYDNRALWPLSAWRGLGFAIGGGRQQKAALWYLALGRKQAQHTIKPQPVTEAREQISQCILVSQGGTAAQLLGGECFGYVRAQAHRIDAKPRFDLINTFGKERCNSRRVAHRRLRIARARPISTWAVSRSTRRSSKRNLRAPI